MKIETLETTTRRLSRRRAQAGTALIEFVLSFTLIILLGLGAVSAGIAVQQSMIVAYAASAGALFGANLIVDGISTPGMQTPDTSSGADGIPAVALNAGATVNHISATAVAWYTCTAGSLTDQGGLTSCSGDQTLTYVKVTSSVNISNPMTLGGLLPSTFTLQTKSVMPAY